MKFKATRKDILAGYPITFSVSYCACQHLFWDLEPVAYTSGIYGWNCDIYDLNGVAIATGYRPFGKSVDYEIILQYESAAQLVCNDRALDFETRREKLADLRRDFRNAILWA